TSLRLRAASGTRLPSKPGNVYPISAYLSAIGSNFSRPQRARCIIVAPGNHDHPAPRKSGGMSALRRGSVPTSALPIPRERRAAPAGLASCPTVIPHDVKKAVDFIRARSADKVTIAELVKVCGVAERTLRKHFCTFLGLAPLEYMRRIR